MVIVYDAHLAQPGCCFYKPIDALGIVHEQTHPEILTFGAVFLRADICDIEAVAGYQLQHRHHRARHIAQSELQQHHVSAPGILQVAYLVQLLSRAIVLLLAALRLDEHGVGIYRLVVAAPRDIHAERGKYPPRPQEGADMIRQCRDIGSSHGTSDSRRSRLTKYIAGYIIMSICLLDSYVEWSYI